MKDVAKKAGVHQTTVSLALRNDPRLKPQTRERIQAIAEEMGYRPDPMLNALSSYRSQTRNRPADQVIGMLINLADESALLRSHVHQTLIRSCRKRAEELGFKLNVFWFGHEYESSRALERVLDARNIHGIVIGGFVASDLELELDWERYSLVKINLQPLELNVDAVLSNQMFAVRVAVRELRKMGYRRIGFASGQQDEFVNRNLFSAGFYSAQRHLDFSEWQHPFLFQNAESRFIHEDLTRWIANERLDALISNYNSFDEVAWDITVNRGQHCRFVPIDADERTRPYGGVLQNHHIIAAKAVEALVGKMRIFQTGLQDNTSHSLIDPTWLPLEDWPPEAPFAYAEQRRPFNLSSMT